MKAVLYLASLAAALSAPSGPKADQAQLALCEKVTAYTKAVTAVANLRAESTVSAIRKAQGQLKDAYADLEQYASALQAHAAQAGTMRVTMGPHRWAVNPAQRLVALLDVSPAAASAGKGAKAFVCVPGGVGTRTQPPPLQYQVKYASAFQCGPEDLRDRG